MYPSPQPIALSVLCGLLVAAALPGCKAEDPPSAKWDSTVPQDLSGPPDGFAGCPDLPALPAPEIDPFPTTTSYGLQPFRGQAPGATLLTADGGSGAAMPVPVGADGKFCIEVQLLLDSKNSVTFTPLDANGCAGQSTTIVIVHESPAGSPDAGSGTITNVAHGGAVSSKQGAAGGNGLPAVVDGDPETYAEVSFQDLHANITACDDFTWIKVDLAKTYTVSRIGIKYPQQVGDSYGECYAVLVSPKELPEAPDPKTTTSWKLVDEDKSATGEDVELTLAPEPVRWVALLLYENGKTTAITETFQIGEIEVWGQDPNYVPPPPQQRCP